MSSSPPPSPPPTSPQSSATATPLLQPSGTTSSSDTSSTFGVAAIVAIAGAALLVVGSMLSWIDVHQSNGTASVGGMSGDGKLTLLFGIVAGVLFAYGATVDEPAVHALGSIAAICGGAVACSRISDIGDLVRLPGQTITVGIGLQLCVAGAVVAVLSGIMAAYVAEQTEIQRRLASVGTEPAGDERRVRAMTVR